MWEAQRRFICLSEGFKAWRAVSVSVLEISKGTCSAQVIFNLGRSRDGTVGLSGCRTLLQVEGWNIEIIWSPGLGFNKTRAVKPIAGHILPTLGFHVNLKGSSIGQPEEHWSAEDLHNPPPFHYSSSHWRIEGWNKERCWSDWVDYEWIARDMINLNFATTDPC